MKIYTKTGDKGKTSLIGGTRVSKSNIRIEAYGRIDELISYIGLIRDQEINKEIKDSLLKIQDRLMVCAALTASDNTKTNRELPCICNKDIQFLEKKIDNYSNSLPLLNSFILPGGNTVVSYCHIARTICRKAERNYVKLSKKQKANKMVLIFLNRLSDYLFVLARKLTIDLGGVEIQWKPKVGNE
ncbi:MAG: cob(I)yrinic acid a,c-diamide adenosyltransferase [Bacteroidales bacterium]|nr:cob(I)yrinic acid a,c-diamide adenosyltransferase [Bacteroidales bacterium]